LSGCFAYRDECFDDGLERSLYLATVAVELAERDLVLHVQEVALGTEDLCLEPLLLMFAVVAFDSNASVRIGLIPTNEKSDGRQQ
jgi:hypothetical protein